MKNYQISAPQYLEKNKVYYIEALFKQGVGFDRMIVGMRTPGGETKVPIGNQTLMLNITEECEYQCLNYHENVLFQKKIIITSHDLLRNCGRNGDSTF